MSRSGVFTISALATAFPPNGRRALTGITSKRAVGLDNNVMLYQECHIGGNADDEIGFFSGH
jgi:hypothetical protein